MISTAARVAADMTPLSTRCTVVVPMPAGAVPGATWGIEHVALDPVDAHLDALDHAAHALQQAHDAHDGPVTVAQVRAFLPGAPSPQQATRDLRSLVNTGRATTTGGKPARYAPTPDAEELHR